jgi:hypothetical protein
MYPNVRLYIKHWQHLGGTDAIGSQLIAHTNSTKLLVLHIAYNLSLNCTQKMSDLELQRYWIL